MSFQIITIKDGINSKMPSIESVSILRQVITEDHPQVARSHVLASSADLAGDVVRRLCLEQGWINAESSIGSRGEGGRRKGVVVGGESWSRRIELGHEAVVKFLRLCVKAGVVDHIGSGSTLLGALDAGICHQDLRRDAAFGTVDKLR